MAATVINEEGVDVGTTPTIYALQPFDKLLCRINYTGPEAASAFTISGTLGGNAATYFYVLKMPNGQFWIAHSGSNRLPDNATGTLVFDGPTGLTTLNPTVISSQGRPITTEDAVSRFGHRNYALITTECWLRFKFAKDRSDSYWQGAANVTNFPDGDYIVDAPAAVATQLSAITPTSGGKYRIRCRNLGDGAWGANGLVLSAVKDFTVGGGCLVIEPYAPAPATIGNRWFITQALKGVEIRGFDHPGSYPTNNNVCMQITGINAQVVLRNNNYVDPHWQPNGGTDGTVVDGTKQFIIVQDAELVRVVGCKFVGAKRHMTFTNCRMAEVNGVDSQQSLDDFSDPTMNCTHRNRWADDDLVYWIHNTRLSNLFDSVTGLHFDFCQYSTALQYAGGSGGNQNGDGSYKATTIQSGDYRILRDTLMKAVQVGAGTTATHPADLSDLTTPTAGSNVTDGTVTWQFICLVKDMPRLYLVANDNVLLSGGSKQDASHSHPGAQFVINSNAAPFPMAVFNNFSHTAQQRGLSLECAYQTERNFVEFNSLLGPHEHPLNGTYINQAIQQNVAANVGKIRAYKNLCQSVNPGSGGAIFDEGNIIVKGQSPGTGQAYWDICRGTQAQFTDLGDGVWRFAVNDDGTDTIVETQDFLSRLFHSASGRVGARAMELYPIQFKVTDSLGNESSVMTPILRMLP